MKNNKCSPRLFLGLSFISILLGVQPCNAQSFSSQSEKTQTLRMLDQKISEAQAFVAKNGNLGGARESLAEFKRLRSIAASQGVIGSPGTGKNGSSKKNPVQDMRDFNDAMQKAKEQAARDAAATKRAGDATLPGLANAAQNLAQQIGEDNTPDRTSKPKNPVSDSVRPQAEPSGPSEASIDAAINSLNQEPPVGSEDYPVDPDASEALEALTGSSLDPSQQNEPEPEPKSETEIDQNSIDPADKPNTPDAEPLEDKAMPEETDLPAIDDPNAPTQPDPKDLNQPSGVPKDPTDTSNPDKVNAPTTANPQPDTAQKNLPKSDTPGVDDLVPAHIRDKVAEVIKETGADLLNKAGNEYLAAGGNRILNELHGEPSYQLPSSGKLPLEAPGEFLQNYAKVRIRDLGLDAVGKSNPEIGVAATMVDTIFGKGRAKIMKGDLKGFVETCQKAGGKVIEYLRINPTLQNLMNSSK